MICFPDSVRLAFMQAGEGCTRNDGFVHRKTVPYIIVAQAVEGRYSIECGDGASADLKTGEAFLTAPDVSLSITHHCDPESGLMRMRWLHFNFSVFNAVGLASMVELPLRVEAEWAQRFGALSKKILAIQLSKDAQSMASAAHIGELSFKTLALLLEFLRSKGLEPKLNPGVRRLLPALKYAREGIAGKVSVGEMAKRAGLSTPRFHAEFKRHLHCPPMEHVRKLRLSKASDLLRASGRSLEEIARETGFLNQFHFSREFKKLYGLPPSAFRKSMREEIL